MDIQPTLHTKRLTLRPFAEEDARDVEILAGNKLIADVTANIPHPYPKGLARQWILTHPQQWQNQKMACFAITTRESGTLLGAISLMHLDQTEGELGYWIGVDYWNQGFCSEACIEIVNFGFNALHLNRIHAKHLSRNPVSGKVLLNSGLSHIHSDLSIRKNDKIESAEHYEILKNGFL